MFCLKMGTRSIGRKLNFLRGFSSNRIEKLVDVAINDKTGIATVTMQRLPVNSLNVELLTSLSDTLNDLDNNNSRGMILTSVMLFIFFKNNIKSIFS